MFKRLDIFDKRYNELEKRMYEPDVVSDPEQYQKVMKEYSSIEPVVKTYRAYKEAQQTVTDSLAILDDSDSDDELRELASIELDEAKILQEIIQRDEQDMNRPIAPLRQAEDAVRIDNSYLNTDEATVRMLEIARQRLK